MSQVFVSYSRGDREWVESVTTAIEGTGLNTWIDTRKIPASVVWMEEIRDAIEASTVVVAFESESFYASIHCATELALASEIGRDVVRVPVGSPPNEVIDIVRDAADRQHSDTARSVELTVRAREWDRRGRGRRGLVGGKTLRALRRARKLLSAEAPNVDAFLRASRRRTVIRRSLITIGVLVVIVATALDEALEVVAEETVAATSSLVAEMSDAEQVRVTLAVDPYAGFELLAALGTTESARDGVLLAEGLASPIPDDRFTIPVDGKRFAVIPVVDDVIVEARDGTIWHRGAEEARVRTAIEAESGSVVGTSDTRSSQLKVRATHGSALVVVESDGQILRRLRASGPVDAASVSPDGRELAVAVGDSVEIIDIDTGIEKVTYRGAPGPVGDIAWAANGSRVWALSGTDVVSWLRQRGSVILDQPDSWFVATFPSASSGAVWAADVSGELIEVDIASGTVSKTISFPGEVHAAGSDPDGTRALVIGSEKTWLVDLANGDLIDVAGRCHPSDPAFASTGPEIYVSCGDHVLVIDRRDGTTIGNIQLELIEAWALAIDPVDDVLILGDGMGGLHRVESNIKSFPHPLGAGCDVPFRSIDVSSQGDVVVASRGTGQLGCSSLIRRSGAGYAWPTMSHTDATSNRARSVLALSDGERYATGYGDGRIIITPITNLLPQHVIHEVSGDVRDMIEIDGDLVIATRAGVLHRFPIDPDPLTNLRLSAGVSEHLERARELGFGS